MAFAAAPKDIFRLKAIHSNGLFRGSEPTHFFRDGINSCLAQRIAFEHPPKGQPSSRQEAVSGNRLVTVFRASWQVTAGAAEKRRKDQLVKADETDTQQASGRFWPVAAPVASFGRRGLA